MCYGLVICLFFFFQAEDGIRDGTVTGVQTCALPIWSRSPYSVCLARFSGSLAAPALATSRRAVNCSYATISVGVWLSTMPSRSEERRVGKECRSRGGRYY